MPTVGALVVFRVLASVGDSVNSTQSTTESEPLDTQSDQSSFDEPLLATGEVFQVTTVDQWRGTVYGYVFGSTAAVEDPPGSCVTVLGAMTADETGNDLVSDGIAAPTIGVIAAGTYYGTDVGRCDDGSFDEAGWSPPTEARITVGTFFPFRSTVYLPPGVDAGVQALVVGDGAGQQVSYVPDEFADVVAAPVGEPGPSAAVGRQLSAVGNGPSAAFDVGADFYGVSWQGTIAGMVEVDGLPGFDGRCLVVLGTLTGFVDDNGSGFFAPPVSVIVRGRDQPGPGLACSIDDVQAAGYLRLGELPPFEATPLPFFEAVPLPTVLFGPLPPDPEMVVVGSALDPAAALFEPTVLDAIPAP